MGERRIRVLLAKVGLDGHDRGVRVVARALMDAGMEVIYTGLRASAAEVARAALEEDVDAVGLSFLAGDHMALVPKVARALTAQGCGEVALLVGGVIPAADIAPLERLGVRRVFLPGTPPAEIVHYIEHNLQRSAIA
jgi:methylmalonyl-CoA mutase C-terminal domain/subunit